MRKWHSGGRSSRSTTTLSVDTYPALPYLVYWSGRGKLRFRVLLKLNQQLFYWNRGSSHTSTCYRAIESGFLGRPAKLTLATAANFVRPMHQLYPEHAKALQRVGLSSSLLPTFRQVLDCRTGSQGLSRSRSATKSGAVFFCLGFSKFGKTPFHLLLRRLRNKYNLLWFRVSMSSHRFNNLRELCQGHLNKVLLRNVDSEDLRDRPCNCPGRGSCRYNNLCRKALIVYKVTIPQTRKYYIGATSQTLKKRMAGHLQDTSKLLKDGVRSSTLASHLAQMWQQNSNSISTAGMLRDELTYSILWQCDTFSCSKTFGKFACKLCQKEQVALLRHSWSDEVNVLNDRSEIHGSCRHTARFHRLCKRKMMAG
jgi:hypothetical protein